MRIADQILHLCGHVWLVISGRCSPPCSSQSLRYKMPLQIIQQCELCICPMPCNDKRARWKGQKSEITQPYILCPFCKKRHNQHSIVRVSIPAGWGSPECTRLLCQCKSAWSADTLGRHSSDPLCSQLELQACKLDWAVQRGTRPLHLPC